MNLRSNPHFRYLLVAVAGFLLFGMLSRKGAAEVIITAQEKWTNVFGDQKVMLHFTVQAKDEFQGRVVWTFAATNGRIFPGGRGEGFVAVKDGKNTVVKIPLQIPPVKSGVVLPALLKIAAVGKGKSVPEATLERKLWIFFNSAFADRSQWLKKLEITVYDPTTEAKTVKLLTKLNIPYEEIRNPAALEELNKGILLIGEGVSFRAERGLDEIVTKLANRGLPVVCLAPEDGSILLPGTALNSALPEQVHWRKQDIITELDKRLDAVAWQGSKSVVVSSLIIKADGGNVVGEVAPGAKGWPWLEVNYADKGKLLIIGFPVIGENESSPTPRYLFARLLEYVTEPSKEAQEKGSKHP